MTHNNEHSQSVETQSLSDRLPTEGSSVLAVFGGQLVEASVYSYSPDKTKVTFITEDGRTKETSVKAVSAEIQEIMQADRPTRMARERGERALDAVGVREPAPDTDNEDSSKYADLLNPDFDDDDNFSVEAAAVRTPETEEEKGLRQLREHHQKVAQNAQIQTGADFYRAGHK